MSSGGPSKLSVALNEFAAEFLGTSILLFFGNGCGGSARLRMINGAWEAGIVWGLGVLAGILASAPVSGAHLNPAVTLGMASCRKLPLWKVPHYLLAQLLGAMMGAGVIYSFFFPILAAAENITGIKRGDVGSFATSGMFHCTLNPEITPAHGFYIEVIITAILLLVICYINDKNATEEGYGPYFPFLMVAFTVAILIACFGPLTAACLNPVRDLGPRIVTYMAGWGGTAFPGETVSPFWPFLIGPSMGGVIGALIWEFFGSRMFKFSASNRQMIKNSAACMDLMAEHVEIQKKNLQQEC